MAQPLGLVETHNSVDRELGIASEDNPVAIPLDQFSWDGDKAAFKLSTTTASLKSMPEWRSETARATTD